MLTPPRERRALLGESATSFRNGSPLVMVRSGQNPEWSRASGFPYTQNNVEDVTEDGRLRNASVGAQKTIDKP